MSINIEKSSAPTFLGEQASPAPSRCWLKQALAAQAVVCDLARKLGKWIEERRRAHAERRDMLSMSNTMLKDIGICRDEIDFAFKHGREKDGGAGAR